MNTQTAKLPFIGVDVGGSHITAAHIDSTTYRVIDDSLIRLRVASMDTAEIIISSWVEALSPLITDSESQAIKIGIAMPGPFDYERGISLMQGMEKYDALYGLNIREILSERLNIPADNIVFMNDAAAFLGGELTSGAAADFDRAIGVTLGTGLGSTSNCTGEIVDVNRAFVPFLESIAEEYISTRWFLKRYKQLTGEQAKNVEELLNTASQEIKEQLFNEFSTNLAAFLNDFIADENPEVLIIGGNIAKTWDYFIAILREKIVNKTVVIRQTQMWENAALVGAASAWINK